MAVAGRRVVVWFHSGCGCGVPIADERFFEFAAGGMRHFERLDARWPSAVRGGGEQHALMCDVAYHPQPNGKTFFIRGEACGGHTCLHELRASARGGFGPPIPAGSNRSGYVRFMVRIAFIRTAACEGTRRLRSGPSPGRSCGPPMASAIAIRTWDRRFSPQPSGRACDQREQPSASGRLRDAAQYVRASEFADGTIDSDATLPSAAQGGGRHTPFKRRSASG